MSIKVLNEGFDKRYKLTEAEEVPAVIGKSETVKGLMKALQSAYETLQAKHSSDIKEYERVFQDAIEKQFPGKEWWEITSTNIFWSLFNDHDPQKTITDILTHLKDDIEDSEKHEDNPLDGARSNILEFPNGEYMYVGYEDGKLFAGYATNSGITHLFEIVYDSDMSLDSNLQKLYDGIVEDRPELLIDESETVADTTQTDIKENAGQDITEYQKWVDYDMEKYNRISDITMRKIKKAGLSVVRDQYGEYEVIADRPLYDRGARGSKHHRRFTEEVVERTAHSHVHPEEGIITKTLTNIPHTNKLVFDYRPYDGVYKVPENHLIVLVFNDGEFNDRDAFDWFRQRRQWKKAVVSELENLGWIMEDPIEDNDTYLYLVLQKDRKHRKDETALKESSAEEVQHQLDRAQKSADEHTAKDVALCIENDYDMYKRGILPVISSLSKKANKGVFDKNLAIQAFYHLVVNALNDTGFQKRYPYSIKNVSVPTRYLAAKYLFDFFEDDIGLEEALVESPEEDDISEEEYRIELERHIDAIPSYTVKDLIKEYNEFKNSTYEDDKRIEKALKNELIKRGILKEEMKQRKTISHKVPHKKNRHIMEKQSNRKRSRKLNEGPGAGYTIEASTSADKINSIKFTKVVDFNTRYGEAYVECDCDIDATTSDIVASSYGYSTYPDKDFKSEEIKSKISSACFRIDFEGTWDEWVKDTDWADFDPKQFVVLLNEHLNEILPYIKDSLLNIETSEVYGGGWSHSTYDGTITTGDFDSVGHYGKVVVLDSAHIVLVDKEAIEYIDRAVQGENWRESWFVVDKDNEWGDSFDNEEEAIAYAKKHGHKKVVRTEDLYGYNDDIIDYVTETVWRREDEEYKNNKLNSSKSQKNKRKNIVKEFSKSLKESYSPDERKKALADYLNIDVEDISDGYENDGCHFETSDGKEYIVADEEEAYEFAKQDILDILDEGGITYFSDNFQNWIIDNILDVDWFDDAMYESNKNYAEDIMSETSDKFSNRLVEEMYEAGILTDEDFEETAEGKVDYLHLINEDSVVEEKIEDFIEYLSRGYADSVEWFRDSFGEEELRSVIINHNLISDTDALVDEAIDWDGVAHFIASYDGHEIELDNALFAYRIS